MDKSPKVSIVIPVLNEAHHLGELLPELSRQSIDPFEIVVADAGSSDSSRQIAEDHGCLIVEGGSPARGRNAGARAAKGDYLVFLDADTRLFNDDFMAQAILEVQRRRLCAAVVNYRPYYRPGDRGCHSRIIPVFDRIMLGIINVGQRIWLKCGFPIGQAVCLIFRADAFKQMEGFDQKAEPYEDSQLLLRMHRHFPRPPKERSAVGILRKRFVYQSMRRYDIKGRFFWPLLMGIKGSFLRWLTKREYGDSEYWTVNKADYDR